jgi:plastocyanin
VRIPLAIGTVMIVAAGGCSGDTRGNGSGMMNMPTSVSSMDAVVVTIVGQHGMLSFEPNPAQAAQGALVVWYNSDSATHRIVMNDGSFDSGAIAPGRSSPMMRLGAAGGGYHCTIHPTMMFGSINP